MVATAYTPLALKPSLISIFCSHRRACSGIQWPAPWLRASLVSTC